MKNKKNMLLMLLLSASMVFSGITVPQAKAKPRTGQDANGNTWEYDRKTRTLTFSGTRDLEYFMESCIGPDAPWWCWDDEAEHLVIEPGITGLPGEEFIGFQKLKTAELPDTVTNIGSCCFWDCSELEIIQMPKHLKSIGYEAFYSCSKWKNAWIPDTVTSIESGAFKDCESIREIEIPDTVTYLGEAVFSGCKNLESVRLPNNLKIVGDEMFFGCEKLSEVSIPDSVKKISKKAFGCSGIIYLEIPEKVTGFYKWEASSGKYGVFQDCKKLKEIVIRSRKINHVFKGAFSRLDKNTVIKVPKGCLKKYKKLFRKAGLDKKIHMETLDGKEKPLSGTDKNGNAWTYSRETGTLEISGTADFGKYPSGKEPGWCTWYSEAEHVIVRDGITGRLPDGSFRLFYKLKTAELPDSVESIGNNAFYGCRDLETVRLPETTTSIEKRAFKDCYRLREVQIPKNIVSVRSRTFENCCSLKAVEVPETVNSIGKSAFAGCENLQEICLPDSVETVGSYAFENCRSLASVRLSEPMEILEEGVFFHCESLAEVKLPETLKKIEKKAFSGSGITRIEIPQNVSGFYEDKESWFPEGVFEHCLNLKEITIRSKKLDNFYKGSWRGVKKQTVIKVPKSCLKKYKKAFRKAWLDKDVKIKAISGKKKFSQITFSEEKYKGLSL